MIRNLKVLIAAALALAAFGAVNATGAQAADEFHCSVNPCRLHATQDGTGATAHQVFIVENAAKTESVSFTCHEITADATVAALTTNEVTATGIEYKTCTVNGSPGVTVDMNGCHYLFTGGHAGTTDLAGVHVQCPENKKIQVTIPAIGCTFEIGSQSLTGIGYQTQGTTPNRDVTLTAKNVGGIATTASAGCGALINPAQTLTGTYTTGNVTVKATDDKTGAAAEAWFL